MTDKTKAWMLNYQDSVLMDFYRETDSPDSCFIWGKVVEVPAQLAADYDKARMTLNDLENELDKYFSGELTCD